MGLQHNPILYLVLSNSLLWGLPLAINHWQANQPSREVGAMQIAGRHTSTDGKALAGTTLIAPADPRLISDPMLGSGSLLGPADSGNKLSGLSDGGNNRLELGISGSRSGVTSSAQLSFGLSDLPMRTSSQGLLGQLRGADGLGGPLTLASLNEPAMPIAARAEQLQWQRSNDALAALPLHWREPLRRELGNQVKVSQAATVRLPVRELSERQEVPVIITDQGMAEGLVKPKHQRTREAVESWAARQQPSQPGTVQVMLVAAEPVEAPGGEAVSTVATLPVAEQHSEPSGDPSVQPVVEPQL